MNKEAFLKELNKRLRYIPEEDRLDAVEYYEGYISDMGLAPGEDVTVKLGSPKEVSKDIIEQCTQKHIDNTEEQKTVKGRALVIWLSILGVLSLPVSLPLTIAVLVVVLSIIITIVAVVFSLIVTVAATGIGGVAAIFWGFTVPGLSQKLFTIGTGLALTGGSVLLGLLIIALCGKIGKRVFRKREVQ
ncbi:MAG: DUF1700 domain-containing protein [Lachnospiraceae bacterium]|nr:DUF1700 domain-containing protein [Lachnospiraceae bacterium]